MRLQKYYTNNMKKKNIAAISITFLILLITAGCSSNKNSGTQSGMTVESDAKEELDVEEFYSLYADDTVYSINEKGEKVGEFHLNKLIEILGLDEKDDVVNVCKCSDKIVVCYCHNSELDESGLYAVNEELGKSTELKEIPDSHCDVDYYNGDFYFTMDNKELICSIDDNLEYVVKEADLGVIFDKVGNKTIDKP